jgi:hypothetical protein
MDVSKIKYLVNLDNSKKTLEKALENIKAKRAIAEKEVLEMLSEAGIPSLKIENKTVYIQRQLWCGAKDKDKTAACEFLKNNDLEMYVKEGFNVLSLSGFVREIEKSGDELPENFEKFFKISEVFSIRSRKA